MAKKKLVFTVLDIEDTKMTGNRAYDLTRPRKGFAIELTASFSIDVNYSLAFKYNYEINEIEDSVNYLIKNKNFLYLFI